MFQPIATDIQHSIVSSNCRYASIYLDQAIVPEDSGRIVIGDKTIIISGKSSVLYVLDDKGTFIGRLTLPFKMRNPEAIAIKNIISGAYTIGIWDDKQKKVHEIVLRKASGLPGITLDTSVTKKMYAFNTSKKIESMAYEPDGTMIFIDRRHNKDRLVGNGAIYRVEKPSTVEINKLVQVGNVGEDKPTDMYPIPGGYAVLMENGIIELSYRLTPVGKILTTTNKGVESLSVTAVQKDGGQVELIVHEGKDVKDLNEITY